MIPAKIERYAVWAVAVIALAGGIALRLYHLMGLPFWLDEAYSAYAADHGFAFLWHVVPRYETHPPLYYSLVRVWSLVFGQTLEARRWLGLACGIAAIPVTGLAADALGRLLGWDGVRRRWAFAIALALAAMHPLMLTMARQVRPYPVMTLVYAAGVLAVLRLARDARDGRALDPRWLMGFTLAEAAMLWLHTLGPLFGASLALALAVLAIRPGLRPRDWAALAATQIVAGLLYLPALLIALQQAPTWIKTTWLVFRTDMLRFDLGLLYATWNPVIGPVVVVIVLAGLAAMARRRWGVRAGLALLALAIVPTAVSIALSLTVSPVFLTRTLSAVTVPALVLTAAGLSWPGMARAIGLPVAALLALTYGDTAWGLAQRGPGQDWYGALRWLTPRMQPGDVVWAYPNEGALPLFYALKDEGRTLPTVSIPGPVPAFGSGGYFVTGSQGVVSLYPYQIAALAKTPAARTPPTIWVLRLGPWKYDPGDRLIRALQADRTIVGHYRKGPIDFTGLRKGSAPVAPPEQPQP